MRARSGRAVARDRAGARLPMCRCGTSVLARADAGWTTAIAVLGPLLTRSGRAEDLPERQVRHAGAGPRRLPDARAGRRHHADLLSPRKPACTATAWTSWRSCIWATRRSRYDEVTGTGRNRMPFAQVPIDRATAYAAEDADVALRLWQALRPRLRINECAGAVRADRAPADPGAAGDGARRHQGRRRRSAPHVGGFRTAHGGDGEGHAIASPASNSTSAARSSWARCCSTRWACPAASG